MPLKCTGSDPKRVGTLWWCGKPAAVVVTIFGHDVPFCDECYDNYYHQYRPRTFGHIVFNLMPVRRVSAALKETP